MAGKKLLIVDDEPEYLKVMENYFKTQGYEVKTANNLEDAVLVFRREIPKVVLLDFNMPLVKGDKFLPILQSVNPAVRAIVISGYTAEDVEQKFKGSGYFAFFEKGSLSLEKVKAKVEEAYAH